MPSVFGIGGWPVRPALTMAGLGLLSGILSATLGYDLELEWLKPVAPIFILDAGQMPIGFFFGAIVALGVWISTRNALALLALVITTMYAWSAAIQVAIRLQRNAGDNLHLIAASLGAGAVGAGLTHLGCALFVPGLRSPARVISTCLVGAAAGMLFYLGERKFIDERMLFVVWQPAVAFCIGLGLAGQDDAP
jgi:hypothetical protein